MAACSSPIVARSGRGVSGAAPTGAAAKASEAWAGDHAMRHWVRAPKDGDQPPASAALGESIGRLVLEGPEADLTLPANAQPAIVTTSVAILEAIRERYPALPLPAFAAGHSLGEYSALVAAGTLTIEDAVAQPKALRRDVD